MISHADMMKFSRESVSSSSSDLAAPLLGGVVDTMGLSSVETVETSVTGFREPVSLKRETPEEVAFKTFAKLNRDKVAIEGDFKGEKLDAELTNLWMLMSETEKRRYFSTFKVKLDLKVKNLEKKQFVPPKSCVQPKSCSSESKSLDKSRILQDLKFFKETKCPKKSIIKNRCKRYPGDNNKNEASNIKSKPGEIFVRQDEKKKTVSGQGDDKNISSGHDENKNTTSEQDKMRKGGLGDHKITASGRTCEKFVCDKCNHSFSYLKSLNNHKLKVSCTSSIECTKCGIKLKNERTLRKHIKEVHERIAYKCGICYRKFASESLTQKHIRFTHEQMECKFCKKAAKNANSLRSHLFICPVKNPKSNKTEGSATRKAKAGLVVGADVSVSTPPKVCSICGKSFETRSGLYNRA